MDKLCPYRRCWLPVDPGIPWLRAWCWLGLLLASWMSPALGQESPAAKPGSSAPELLPGEVGPSTFLLGDRDHKLQPVLNFQFEDFARLFEQQQQASQAQQKPPFVIDSVEGELGAAGVAAQLDLQVSLSGDSPTWTKVPLRLGGVALRSIDYQGGGEYQVELGEEQGTSCYWLWLRTPHADGNGKPSHQVRLRGVVALSKVASENQLRLTLPSAAKTHLQLSLPGQTSLARVSGGNYLLGNPVTEETSVHYQLEGAGGPLSLLWSEKLPEQTLRALLDVQGLITLRYEAGNVFTEATFTVKSLQGPIESMQLRLPDGAVLAPGENGGLQLIPLQPDEESTEEKRYEARLPAPLAGPLVFKVTTQAALPPEAGKTPLRMEGFEVIGAARQHGHVLIRNSGTQQLSWSQLEGLYQVDEPPTTIATEEVAASFEYYGPWALKLSPAPQKAWLRIQPEYRVNIEADRLRMRARFVCSARGSRMRTLGLQLAGWELDEISPDRFATSALVPDQPGGELAISLPTLSGNDFEIEVTGHRVLRSGTTQAEIDLPQLVPPSAPETVVNELPGTLAVLAAENLDLHPDVESMHGLMLLPSREALSDQAVAPQWLYRSESGSSRFAAHWRLRPRRTTVETRTRIDIKEHVAQVEQVFRYEVAFEPLDAVQIRLPSQFNVDPPEITLEGQRLKNTDVTSEGPDRSTLFLRAALPRPRMDRFDLVLSYRVPLPPMQPATTALADIPLPMPAGDATQRFHTLSWSQLPGMTVTERKNVWSPRAPQLGNGSTTETELVSLQPQLEACLAITASEFSEEGILEIEDALIQTRISTTSRSDRWLMRMKGGGDSLKLELPPELTDTLVVAKFDKSVVKTTLSSSNRLQIALPSDRDGKAHWLELQYTVPSKNLSGNLVLAVPQLLSPHLLQHAFWQVSLPPSEHLLASDEDHLLEMHWARQGLYWARQTAPQGQLDQLLSAWPSTFPQGSNNYLFSSSGPIAPLRITTLQRSNLVLLFSGLVLGVGLLLIYLPPLRRTTTLFLGSVGICAFSLWNQDLAILAAQGSALGVVLAFLATLLAVWIPRESVAAEVPGSKPVAVRDRSSTTQLAAPVRPLSIPSTATVNPAATASEDLEEPQ